MFASMGVAAGVHASAGEMFPIRWMRVQSPEDEGVVIDPP
jgi:hypothetical protein